MPAAVTEKVTLPPSGAEMLNGWAEMDGALKAGVVLMGAEPPPPQLATAASITRGISLMQAVGKFIFRISVLNVGLNNSKNQQYTNPYGFNLYLKLIFIFSEGPIVAGSSRESNRNHSTFSQIWWITTCNRIKFRQYSRRTLKCLW